MQRNFSEKFNGSDVLALRTKLVVFLIRSKLTFPLAVALLPKVCTRAYSDNIKSRKQTHKDKKIITHKKYLAVSVNYDILISIDQTFIFCTETTLFM